MKRLTQFSFFLIVALVIVRATTLELLREPFEVSAGSSAYPRGLGVAGSVILDWLAILAPILILARAALDRSFSLARSRCFIPAIALALWIAASGCWASDTFSAVVGASHFVGGIAVFWASAQLVRSGLRVRFIAGACVGLLLVLVAYGLIYRYIELPDLRTSVEKNWTQILTERGWAPDSFMADRFHRKVMAGEMVGFSASPNSLAALLVTLGVVAAGAIVQRIVDRDSSGWAWLIALPIPPAIVIIAFTQSRTAFATPILAGMIGVAFLITRRWTSSRRGHAIAFACVCACFIAGTCALTAYGIRNHNLIQDSLNFRWKYWTGSARLIAAHPLIGLGWNNFGDAYLAVRELSASEEIKDPHNLFVRFATELGFVGLSLSIAWLAMMWWSITRPIVKPKAIEESIDDREQRSYARSAALSMLIWTAAGAIALNVVFSVDLAQDLSWIFIELMKRALFGGLILIGLILGVVRSFEKQELDERSAPWIRRAIVIAIAVFLIHNLIDFSLFESGPMWVFMLLCGAAVGANAEIRSTASRATISASMATLSLLWLAALGVIVAPIVVAESRAAAGDDAFRADHPRQAAALLTSAFDALPFSNGDYLFRAGTAQIAGDAPDVTRATFRRAMAVNPMASQYPRRLADFESRQASPDVAAIRELYDRTLALNPNDVAVRLDYAKTLDHFNLRNAALAQYRIALEVNDGLSPDEPKRLNASDLETIRRRLTQP